MAFTRYAYFDADVLDIKGSAVRFKTASLDKIADFENFRTDDGYMYVRIRAISSRVNKNHDGWPSVELAGSPDIFQRHQAADGGFVVEASEGNPEYGFATFKHKPIFVDHNNSNPRKGRGVIRDSKFRVLDQKTASGDKYWTSANADPEHLPACEVELLLEVDAQSYPKFAKAIIDGHLDGFSMGANVEYTKCSHCNKVAHDAADFCSHILMKGAHHDYKTADGHYTSRASYENCYKVAFFEISGVFDPADETALAREVRAGVYHEDPQYEQMQGGNMQAPVLNQPDPTRDHSQVAEMAMALQMEKGLDPQTAMDMAIQHFQTQEVPREDRMKTLVNGNPQDRAYMGLPGHGEGISPQLSPQAYDRLPEGLTVPYQNLQAEAPNGQLIGNDPYLSATKTAENPLPQEFMTRAPDEVDTLRDEQVCPVCGSEMDDETCKVCGFVKPLDGFDNPDLTKAQDIRDEMAQADDQQALEQHPNPVAPQGTPGQQGGPLTSRLPSKSPVAASVTNDMRWTPEVHPKTAARINQVEVPVRPANQPTSNEPSTETVLSDQTRPVTAAMLTARRLIAAAQKSNQGDNMQTRTADGPTPPGDTSPKTRVDVVGVGGVDEASNEAASKADAQVDVVGVGGTGVSDVGADKSESLPTAGRDGDDSGFNTDKQIEEIHTETFGDKDGEHPGVTDPVTNETLEQQSQQDGKKSGRTAYDDNTLEQNEQQGDPIAQGGSANQGVQPADPVATDSYKRENVLEHHTTPANNSGPTTTWSGTDGNGVLKQQDPVTSELPASGGVTYPDVKLHTTRVINAMRVAETEIELGLTSPEAKFNRIEELSMTDPTKVAERMATLSQVKTAGQARIAATKTATTFPRAFGKATAAAHHFERIASDTPEQQPVTDELMDSAIFSR